jgi:hypothetical protein
MVHGTHAATDTRTSGIGKAARSVQKIAAMVTGLALGLGILLGSAAAGEKFTLLENIPVQAMSQSEMAQAEGKWAPTPLEALFLARLRGDATKFGLSLGPFHASLLSQIPGGLFGYTVSSPVFPSPFVTPVQAMQLLSTPASPAVRMDLCRQIPSLCGR